MPAPTHEQLRMLIQQETDMFDALVEASNDAYIMHRAWRELLIENQRLKEQLAKEIVDGHADQRTHDLGALGTWSVLCGGSASTTVSY